VNMVLPWYFSSADRWELPNCPEVRSFRTSVWLNAQTRQACLHLVLVSVWKMRSIIGAVGARIERSFADFAQIPYIDARTRAEVIQCMDELESATPVDII
jgi:hypothetical protein